MTLPGGLPQVDHTEWGITGDPTGGASTPANLGTWDQATITAALKAQMLASPGWNASKNNVFAGQGITGTLGLSGGTIKAFLQKLTGMPLGVTTGGLPDILQKFTGIPASQIFSGTTQNLLLNPQFTFGMLSWTSSPGAFDYVADFGQGNAAPGSAKVVANGTLKTAVSESIWVQQGDTVTVSGYRMFSGGTATGTPIKLVLEALDFFGAVVSTTAIGSTAGSGSAAWAQITGSDFLVPSGVNWVRAKLVVDTTITAGSVWFDDIVLTKNGALPGMPDAVTNISSLQAAVTTLQQAGNPGQSVLVDFSTLANTANLPAIFTQSYSGSGDNYGVDAGRAKLTSITLPMSARSTTALYNVFVTNTDIQIVSGTWTTGPVNDGFGNRAYCRLDGRKNAADTTKVYVEFAADSAELGCYVAGVKTIFATIGNGGTGFFYFKPGAQYVLRCGTPSPAAADRVFTVFENGAPIIGPFTDGSAVSQMGALYRGGGLGDRWPVSSGNVRPGELMIFGFADN